jgi:hypothetical protein
MIPTLSLSRRDIKSRAAGSPTRVLKFPSESWSIWDLLFPNASRNYFGTSSVRIGLHHPEIWKKSLCLLCALTLPESESQYTWHYDRSAVFLSPLVAGRTVIPYQHRHIVGIDTHHALFIMTPSTTQPPQGINAGLSVTLELSAPAIHPNPSLLPALQSTTMPVRRNYATSTAASSSPIPGIAVDARNDEMNFDAPRPMYDTRLDRFLHGLPDHSDLFVSTLTQVFKEADLTLDSTITGNGPQGLSPYATCPILIWAIKIRSIGFFTRSGILSSRCVGFTFSYFEDADPIHFHLEYVS